MKGNAFHVASEIESVAAYRRVHQKLCFCVAFELVRAMRQARMVKKAQLESGIEKDEGNRPRKKSIMQEKYFLLCSCFACQILSCESLNIKHEDCTMGPRSLLCVSSWKMRRIMKPTKKKLRFRENRERLERSKLSTKQRNHGRTRGVYSVHCANALF